MNRYSMEEIVPVDNTATSEKKFPEPVTISLVPRKTN
jgi:hypothetical protein